jgi:hypothetical protein
MKSGPLAYSPPNEARRRIPLKPLAIIAAIAVVLYCARFITVRKTLQMDGVTGSTQSQTVWPLGIPFGPRLDPSPLELRLGRMGASWNRSWFGLRDTEYTIWGSNRGCSTSPPIYQLRPVMKQFVDASTDDELRDFVAVMQTGAGAQQAAAIDAAAQKGLRSMR